MNIYEKIQKQKEERKAQAELSAASSSDNNYVKFEAVGVELDNQKVVRIIGDPIDPEQFEIRKSTHPKVVLESKIVDDEGKHFTVNWPVVFDKKADRYMPNDTFILKQIWDDLHSGEWRTFNVSDIGKEFQGHKCINDGTGKPMDEESKKNGYWHYNHFDMPSFKRMKTNRRKNEQYPKKFWPSTRIIINVIDRMDNWCKDNKHSKIISSGVRSWTPPQSEDPILFIDNGIPETAYDMIFAHYVQTGRDWRELDCVIQRQKAGRGPQVYDIRDARDADYIRPVADKAIDGPLTKEEQAYEMYDLDVMFKVVDPIKIKDRLIGFIRSVDEDLMNNKKYETLLNTLIERSKNGTTTQQEQPATSEPESSPADAPASTPDPVQSQPAEPSNNGGDSFANAFPSLDSLTETEQNEMKKAVKGFNGNVPIYNDGVKVYPCVKEGCVYVGTEQQAKYPDSVVRCPVCGTVDPSAAG